MSKFAFTFGGNHRDVHGNSLRNAYLVVEAETYGEAREVMFGIREASWAFQYEWDQFMPQIERFNLYEVHIGDLV